MSKGTLFYSRKFLFANLVLTGVIVGFVLSMVLFSCSTAVEPPSSVQAQESERSGQVPVLDAESLQDSFRATVERILPTVVQIEIIEIRQGSPQGGGGAAPWFDFFFGEPEGDGSQPTPEFRNPGLGSGVIVRQDGDTFYVLTNDHVVANADEISVTLDDLREFHGHVVGTDPRRDLALVSFETDEPDIFVAPLGDSSELRVGDWVLAMGSPFGFQSTVTAGIVSATGRMGGPQGNISDFIQTDAAINRGNSGGPLVNLAGEVVGINTWITSQTGGSMGLGFSIPINNARRAIDQFIATGEVEYGWLGVSIPDTPAEVLAELGLTRTLGAMIHNVFRGSPAWEYGLLPGDYVTGVNGARVRTPEELTLLVGDLIAGEEAEFEVIRLGERMTFTVTVGRRDDDQTVLSAQGNLWPGLRIQSLTDAVRRSFSIPASDDGVVIAAVESRTPAADAGLRRGDVVTAVNGSDTSDAMDFYRALGAGSGRPVRIEYLRNGQARTATING